jgi:hypothetical protein
VKVLWRAKLPASQPPLFSAVKEAVGFSIANDREAFQCKPHWNDFDLLVLFW